MAEFEKKIFVIIVSFNGLSWIEKCISSVLNSTLHCRILVIDNCSSDKTIEVIREKFKKVEIYSLKKNVGFGAANNFALKIALKDQADYVFLLNQDAWIEPNTLEKLINIHNINPEFGILAPIRKTSDFSIENNILQNIVQKNCQQLLSDAILKNYLKEVYEINYISAAAWLISKECLLKVGGFDPIFFHYGEDNDYAERVFMHNFKIGICPLATIIHDVGDRAPSKVRKNRMLKALWIYNMKFKKQSTFRLVIYFVYCLLLELFFEKTNFLKSVSKIRKNRKLSKSEYPVFL